MANTITMTGNYGFHYDEALSRTPEEEPDPDTPPIIPKVVSWVEWTSADDIRDMSTILDEGI